MLPATTATQTSEDFPVGTNYWRWPSRNSPIARACAIESCSRALQSKLYHMGFRGKMSRSTLADANESHDWRIFAEFAQVLIGIARPLHAHDPIGVDLDQSLYALDSTTIDLCLSLTRMQVFTLPYIAKSMAIGGYQRVNVCSVPSVAVPNCFCFS